MPDLLDRSRRSRICWSVGRGVVEFTMHAIPSDADPFSSSTSRSTPWIGAPVTGGEHGMGQALGGGGLLGLPPTPIKCSWNIVAPLRNASGDTSFRTVRMM